MTVGEDLAERLAEHCVPLETDDPGVDLAAIDPLRAVLEDRTVVGLGEATHGTREFFRLKHRLVRFLVEELDYRVFALEAAFSETLAIDDYVVHGEGDPVAALDGIHFWTWDTEEVLSMIEWLRAENADRPVEDRVRFFGVDAQHTVGPAEALREYFSTVDPAFLAAHEEQLDRLADGISPWTMDDEAFDRAIDGTASVVEEIPERIQRRREEYVETTGEHEWELAARHARVLERAHRLKAETRGEEDPSWEIREAAMAENVEWILEYLDAGRLALWGHNGHVGTGRREWADATGPSLGQRLRDSLGEGYYALGFEFGDGSFQALPGEEVDASGLQAWTAADRPDGALADPFLELEAPIAVLDFETAREDDAPAAWLDAEHPRRSIGAMFYDEPQFVEDVPSERFDGLAFVAETERARPIDREDGAEEG